MTAALFALGLVVAERMSWLTNASGVIVKQPAPLLSVALCALILSGSALMGGLGGILWDYALGGEAGLGLWSGTVTAAVVASCALLFAAPLAGKSSTLTAEQHGFVSRATAVASLLAFVGTTLDLLFLPVAVAAIFTAILGGGAQMRYLQISLAVRWLGFAVLLVAVQALSG